MCLFISFRFGCEIVLYCNECLHEFLSQRIRCAMLAMERLYCIVNILSDILSVQIQFVVMSVYMGVNSNICCQ